MKESKKLVLSIEDTTALSSAVSACWDNYKSLKLQHPKGSKNDRAPRGYFTTGYIADLKSFLGDRQSLIGPVFAKHGKKVSDEYEEAQTRNNYRLGEAWFKGRLTNLYGFSESLNAAKESQRSELLGMEIQL